MYKMCIYIFIILLSFSYRLTWKDVMPKRSCIDLVLHVVIKLFVIIFVVAWWCQKIGRQPIVIFLYEDIRRLYHNVWGCQPGKSFTSRRHSSIAVIRISYACSRLNFDIATDIWWLIVVNFVFYCYCCLVWHKNPSLVTESIVGRLSVPIDQIGHFDEY